MKTGSTFIQSLYAFRFLYSLLSGSGHAQHLLPSAIALGGGW